MSKEFIEKRIGGNYIDTARRQQRDISYFTQSEVQTNVGYEYYNNWANDRYSGNAQFLSWVSSILKTNNFVTFFKYLRHPVPSSRLVNDKIKSDLSRVFFSEDSFFKYTLRGEEFTFEDDLDKEKFNKFIFDAILFNYNDILVTNLKDTNEPHRELISIKDVVAIESSHGVIRRVAYCAGMMLDDEWIDGYMYIDENEYAFYDKEFKREPIVVAHDLERCPADYLTVDAFSTDNDIVRKSVFSYVKEEMEEYVFLKTLQRMTEPNGAIPVVTKLKTSEKTNPDIKHKTGNTISGSDSAAMDSSLIVTGQQTIQNKDGSDAILETGTRISVPAIKKQDGSVDMEMVKNFLNFFYIPVESLDYINERVKQLEKNIVVTTTGDFNDPTESSKNELQISRSYLSRQDALRSMSLTLTRIANRSDYNMLALKYGKDAVTVDEFYGSDFFLESAEELHGLFDTAPNPVERKSILIRIAQNRSRFNKERGEREVLLYKLMPYISDKDFNAAVDAGQITEVTFQYYSRFTYWIGVFESLYGDIVQFFNLMDGTDSQKLILINNLITNIIKQDGESNSSSQRVQSKEQSEAVSV